ncbi:hypothetical protein OROGR_031024 [Orobanche gracilis]
MAKNDGNQKECGKEKIVEIRRSKRHNVQEEVPSGDEIESNKGGEHSEGQENIIGHCKGLVKDNIRTKRRKKTNEVGEEKQTFDEQDVEHEYEHNEEQEEEQEDAIDEENQGPHQLSFRCYMQAFRKLLNALNSRQHEAVDEIGFGHVCDVTISRVPSRLCNWLFHNFNENSSELMLSRERRILITDEDVRRVYGFPHGRRSIVKFVRRLQSESHPLFEEWMTFFPETNWNKVTMKQLNDAILSQEDGGTWFKRLFMVAVQTTFMECNSNGYISPFILNSLEDVDQLHQWNWGEYVMNCLVHHKNLVVEKGISVFGGPIVFLLVFYVDRVRFRKVHQRHFPIIANWTSKQLKDREELELKAGLFGDGLPLEPIELAEEPVRETPRIEHIPLTAPRTDDGMSSSNLALDVNFQVLTYAKRIASLAVEMMEIIAAAPSDVAQSQSFHVILEKAMKAVTKTPMQLTQSSVPESVGLSQFDDSFLNNTEVLKMLNDVDLAIAKRDESLHRLEEGSLFSNGFTQILTQHTDVPIENPATDQSEHIYDDLAWDIENQETSIEGKKNSGDGTGEGNVTDGRADTSVYVEAPHYDPHIVVHHNTREGGEDGSVRQAGTIVIAKATVVGWSPTRKKTRARGSTSGDVGQLHKRGNDIQNPPQKIAGDQSVAVPKKRSKCAMNKTLAFRSPFIIRQVNISKRLTKPEIKCGVYALLNLTVDSEDLLFSNGVVELQKKDMSTLAKNSVVGVGVVDAWCLMLNHMEISRSVHSPARFFASTFVCTDAFVQKDVTDTVRKESFFENMTMELEANKHLHLNDIDIVIKFLGVCADARTGNFTVLDSMNVDASDCQVEKDVFSKYLSFRNQSKWTMMMKNGSFHILIIEQGDKKDSVNSGVYLMRHMEMFMGDASAKWETGISVKSTKQIATLRIRYCGELMCWEHNIVKDQVLTKAQLCYNDICADPTVKPEKLLMA